MDDSTAGPAAAGARVPTAAPAAAAEPPPPPLAPLPPQEQQQQQPPPPPAAAQSPPAAEAGGDRQRFAVELRPAETTIVSWKKLLKEAGHGGARGGGSPPLVAEPVFVAHAGPSGSVNPEEIDPKEAPPPNRFSAVIEKIERLYMGKQSSDEEDLDDVPDDDQYDTEDSFIDDTELDEYFQVDNLATKHNGYFVNKGKLEQIEPGTSPNVAPKKRRRKDSSSTSGEKNRDFVSGDHSSMGSMPVKASGSSASYLGKKLSSSNLGSSGDYYYEDNRVMKNKINVPTGAHKKKSTDYSIDAETAANLKISSKDVSLVPSEPKEFNKVKAGAPRPVDITHKSRTSQTYDYVYPSYRDKDISSQLDFQSKKALNGEGQDVSTKVRHKEKYGTGEFADMSTSGSAYSMQAVHPVAARVREGSSIRPKGTRLERAIRDLEKIVAESRPPSLDIQEVDPTCQVVKRRLPQEVKQRLAKVARLSASQGKIPEHELIDRLMGILGHLVQRRTLKKNMKEMVESGLSAKQEKADRFQQIKKEVNEMIRARATIKTEVSEQLDGSADDFQEVINNERAKGKSVMDAALEDKICDLYDLYVEGMDEDKGPMSRKLYVELADLWPQGHMDNVGIKDAISRSKERRRALYRQQKVRNEERMKRKRLAAAAKLEEGNRVAAQALQIPQVSQTCITNPITTFPVIDFGQNQISKNVAREMTTGAVSDDGNRNAVDVKKKKRKSESDLAELQANPLKVPLQHGKEKHKSYKHADETNASSQASKASIPVLGLPSYDQPS